MPSQNHQPNLAPLLRSKVMSPKYDNLKCKISQLSLFYKVIKNNPTMPEICLPCPANESKTQKQELLAGMVPKTLEVPADAISRPTPNTESPLSP